MKILLTIWGLIFTNFAVAAALPFPDALDVQLLAARKDMLPLQGFLQGYQSEYDRNPASERHLLQAYRAIREQTDTTLEDFYDRWVARDPLSYEAHVARANYAWGRATLIAHPKANSGGVRADSAWLQYRNFLDKAQQDLVKAQSLKRQSLAADRTLIAVCSDQGDDQCVNTVYQQAIAKAPSSLALRRGYLATTDIPAIWTQVIAAAEKSGVSAEGIKVLKAEQQLNNSREIREADGATEVAVYRGIVGAVQDPWLDERAAHMFMRRKNYADALPLYNRALAANPNLTDALYWRGQAYYATGDFQAAHADTMHAALIGNPQANRELIDAYIRGEKGLAKDFVAATRWCLLGAQNDQSYGAFCLADLYANGYAGYPRDQKKSLKWIKRAAELGHQTAQHDLGVILLNGLDGQAVDRKAGIYWLKLSAAGGFEYARKKLKLHLSNWEYFKEVTWPGYRDSFSEDGFSFRRLIGI